MFDFSKLTKAMGALNAVPGLKDLASQLGNATCEGLAGGGLVRVTLKGRMCAAVHIDPSLLDPSKQTVVQDLVKHATSEALKQMAATEAQAMMGALGKMMSDPATMKSLGGGNPPKME